MLSFYAHRRLTPHEAIYALGYRETPEYSWIDGRPVYMLNTENGKRIFFIVQHSGWTFVRIFANALDVKNISTCKSHHFHTHHSISHSLTNL